MLWGARTRSPPSSPQRLRPPRPTRRPRPPRRSRRSGSAGPGRPPCTPPPAGRPAQCRALQREGPCAERVSPRGCRKADGFVRGPPSLEVQAGGIRRAAVPPVLKQASARRVRAGGTCTIRLTALMSGWAPCPPHDFFAIVSNPCARPAAAAAGVKTSVPRSDRSKRLSKCACACVLIVCAV